MLIAGLGAQMVGWREAFVQQLVDRHLFVVRLDNRDVGLSDKMAGADVHVADYGIDALADDACRVLDTLGLPSAHVAGESMGGGIAQRMAITRPDCVRSATLFYTSPGFDPAFLTEELLERLGSPPALFDLSRDQAIAVMIEAERVSAASDYPFDEAWYRRSKELAYDRCYRPDGALRQASMVARAGGWRDELGRIRCPVAIIHGRTDRLIKPEAALELGRLIPHAEVHIYRGMGHAPVPELWDEYIPIMLRTIARGEE
nr:alpha/beta hydrolase [Sphingomonas chungangi]